MEPLTFSGFFALILRDFLTPPQASMLSYLLLDDTVNVLTGQPVTAFGDEGVTGCILSLTTFGRVTSQGSSIFSRQLRKVLRSGPKPIPAQFPRGDHWVRVISHRPNLISSG